ncbi:MAG: hypothetical protein BGO57_05955 [Sphingomonadales bacterium 63-6]|nr:MAG: hypothetical protein BGO57_05955 [Sphingomonadales bacterium 63-6]
MWHRRPDASRTMMHKAGGDREVSARFVWAGALVHLLVPFSRTIRQTLAMYGSNREIFACIG